MKDPEISTTEKEAAIEAMRLSFNKGPSVKIDELMEAAANETSLSLMSIINDAPSFLAQDNCNEG